MESEDMLNVMHAIMECHFDMVKPHAIFKPQLKYHNDLWYAYYGENLFGSGDTPDAACKDFNQKFWHGKSKPK